MDGILGTAATKTSDLVLLAYVFILLPGMVVGFLFARRKMFVPYHKLTMTGVTLINWVLIIYVMLVSYSYNVAPDLPGNLAQLYALIATIHLVTGAMAQLLATYLVLMMWTERTRFEGLMPAMVRLRRIKGPMRLTLGLWVTTVILGVGLYFTWYVGVEAQPSALVPPGATEQAEPGVTPEVSPDVAVTENATSPAVTEDATGDVAMTPPAVTEDATGDVAVTEQITPPAVTEDATGDVAVTEQMTPPAVTEDANNTSTRKAPATTEAARSRSTATKRASSRPSATEAVMPSPAVTESVDDHGGKSGGKDD